MENPEIDSDDESGSDVSDYVSDENAVGNALYYEDDTKIESEAYPNTHESHSA